MKNSFALLAAALFIVGSTGCASKPRYNEPPRQTSAANGYEDNNFETNNDGGTTSGAPSSLGAASSGRGH